MTKDLFNKDLLKGKVAIITGGGSGICKGITLALAQHGAAVFVIGRRTEPLEEVCKEINAFGGKAGFHSADVRDHEACVEAANACEESFGRIDFLVNGAAGNFLCPTEHLSPGGFRAVVEIDLIGTFQMCQAVRPVMEQTGGVILNISATLHYQGTPLQAGVMAAKAGIDALARNLAVEWAEKGIRVVGIAPGPIAGTEGVTRLAPLGADKKMAREIPMARLGEINEIANAALFLLSDAASYITGETLVVDGGAWLYKPPFVDKETMGKLMAQRKS